MRMWTAVLALAAGLGRGGSAAAQETQATARESRSISLGVDEGIEIGYWTRLSERYDLGLNVGLAYETLDDDTGEQSLTTLSLEPAIKRYAAADGPFLPYGYGSVFASYGRLSSAATADGGSATVTSEQTRYGASAGFGLDWFPARRVSLGGHVGVTAGYQSNDLEGSFEDQTADGFFINTFTSGIRAHLYF